MRTDFLPFCRPSISEREIAAASEVLRSGWETAGPRVEELEGSFRNHVGAGHAVSVSSGTAGFHLALDALSLQPGDEVITSSLTWPSPVNMIQRVGARPVFADIDRETFQLDPESVASRITSRTRVILPVHFAGQPVDLDALRELCEAHDLVLLEDAAHTVGTDYRGEPVGSGESFAVFSFQAIKNVTCAEGGMVVTPDDDLAARLRSLRFHGVTRDAWKRSQADAVARRDYDVVEAGWKYNLTDIQAAIAKVQLDRQEELGARRERLAGLYDAALEGTAGIVRQARVAYPARHAWHLYTVLVDREGIGWTRDAFRDALRQRNIGTGLHFLAVHQTSFYRQLYPEFDGSLPETEYVAARILSLPFFPDMTEGDVEDVVQAIHDVVRNSTS